MPERPGLAAGKPREIQGFEARHHAVEREPCGDVGSRPAAHRAGERGPAHQAHDGAREGIGRPAGTRMPVRPCSTSSGMPPTAVAITGSAIAIASRIAFGNASDRDGSTKASCSRQHAPARRPRGPRTGCAARSRRVRASPSIAAAGRAVARRASTRGRELPAVPPRPPRSARRAPFRAEARDRDQPPKAAARAAARRSARGRRRWDDERLPRGQRLRGAGAPLRRASSRRRGGRTNTRAAAATICPADLSGFSSRRLPMRPDASQRRPPAARRCSRRDRRCGRARCWRSPAPARERDAPEHRAGRAERCDRELGHGVGRVDVHARGPCTLPWKHARCTSKRARSSRRTNSIICRSVPPARSWS